MEIQQHEHRDEHRCQDGAVFTKYNGETPYFVGTPKFVRVREVVEDDETDTDTDTLDSACGGPL